MFVGFRARLYIGFLLAECSCIASGLGAYPEHWVNRSGEGPKFRKILTDGDADRQRELNQLPGEPVQQQAIDFNTVRTTAEVVTFSEFFFEAIRSKIKAKRAMTLPQ